MKLDLNVTETFIEIDIEKDGMAIGRAEVRLPEKMLCNFEIYPPYQDNGYGQEALRMLIEKYDIADLCVKRDNDKAMHIYKKFGFVENEESSYVGMIR